jgi:hypothetical protein
MKVSVLTCVLGNPEELKDTFNSLLPHLSDDFGWLIKATDSNEGYLAQFQHPNVKIVNQKDNSIYDGMNQGLFALDAEWYFVLGAGDIVLQDTITVLKQTLNSTDESSHFFGLVFRKSNNVSIPNPQELSSRMACPHPSAVYRVKNSQLLNGFDTKYLIASDYDHTCRYVKQFGNGKSYSNVLVSYMGGGLSDIRSMEGYLEEELIRKRVWAVNDYQIYASMLNKGSRIAINILGQLGSKG